MSTHLSRVDLMTPSAWCDTQQDGNMIGFEQTRSHVLPWQLTHTTPKSCAAVLNNVVFSLQAISPEWKKHNMNEKR